MTDVSHLNSSLPKLESIPDAPSVGMPTELTETALQTSEVFRPTEYQCRIKQRLWSRFEPSIDATSIESLSKAAMVKLTGCPSIPQWAKHPGFIAWLTNPNVYDEKLAYLEHLSFEALEDILKNNDPKAASARHSVARTVLEATGKIKSKEKKDSSGDSPPPGVPDMSKMRTEDLARIVEVSTKKDSSP